MAYGWAALREANRKLQKSNNLLTAKTLIIG